MPNKIDLTGQRFGRLIVTGEAPRKFTSGGVPKVMWYCDCDCGTKHKAVSSMDLRGGRTKSCGCWNKEKAKFPKEYNRKQCKYDLTGKYGIGYTAQGDKFYFDLEDYDLIKDYSWHVHHKYIVASGRGSHDDRKEIIMHRLVMGNPDKKYDVDHIQTESKNDNRKCNLRIVNRSENNTNKVIQKNNTSGVPGVKWHSRDKIWEVFININKKYTYIGRFNDFDEAVKARREAEDKYYGQYSYENSQLLFLENDLKDYLKNIKEKIG